MIKPRVASSPKTFCFLIKVSIVLIFILVALHFYVRSFHPAYHGEIVNHLNSKVARIMQQNKFDLDRILEHSDDEPFELADPEYEKYIKQLGLVEPGEFGAGVKLSEDIPDEIKKKVQEGFDRHGFNSFVSNMISLNRKLNDTRPEVCKNRTYTDLPKCSVIIPIHNEEWSLLLRTVHAVMNRSPEEALEEVLLVDDASDRGRKTLQLFVIVFKNIF